MTTRSTIRKVLIGVVATTLSLSAFSFAGDDKPATKQPPPPREAPSDADPQSKPPPDRERSPDGERSPGDRDRAGPRAAWASRPSEGALRERIERMRESGRINRGPGPLGRLENEPISDEEWDRIEAFLKEHAPVRLAMYQELLERAGPESFMVSRIRMRVGGKARMLIDMQERAPELYEFAVRQFEIEDKLAGLLRTMRDPDERTPERKKEAAQLVRELIENNLDEREARLAKMREDLAREEAELARDRQRMDELIEKRLEGFQREYERLVNMSEGGMRRWLDEAREPPPQQ